MSKMNTKIASLPSNLIMPLAHLEFEQIEVETHSRHKYFDYVKKIGGVFLKGLNGAKVSKNKNVFGYEFKGERFDCGSKLGFIKANLGYGFLDNDIKNELKIYLKSI